MCHLLPLLLPPTPMCHLLLLPQVSPSSTSPAPAHKLLPGRPGGRPGTLRYSPPPPRGRGRGPRRSCCSSSPSWPESAGRAGAIPGGAGGKRGGRRPGGGGGEGREEEEANPKGGILHPAGGGGAAAGRPGSPWQDLSVRGRTLLHRGRVPAPPLLWASLSPSSGRLSLSPPLTFFKLSGEWKMVGCSLLLLLFARSRLCGVLFLPPLRGGLLLRRGGGSGRGGRHEAEEAQEERNCNTKTSREAELFFNPIHPARPQHTARRDPSAAGLPACLPAARSRHAAARAPARPGPARPGPPLETG